MELKEIVREHQHCIVVAQTRAQWEDRSDSK